MTFQYYRDLNPTFVDRPDWALPLSCVVGPIRQPTQEGVHNHWGWHHVYVHGRPLRALRRYVRYEREAAGDGDGDGDEFDGTVSGWCDDEAALERTMEAAMQAAGLDEQRFSDHRRSQAFVLDDDV